MRILFIILFFSLNASAANYFVSNTGSDAANGLTTETAWQTISKINGFTFSEGDSIFLKKGDTWVEKLRVPRSNLYFGSYSTGAKPILTGFVNLTMTNAGGNIWTGTATQSIGTGTTDPVNTYASQNTVIINGFMRAKGKYPNSPTYLTSTTNSTGITLLTTEQNISAFNFTGGEVVIRTSAWLTDVRKIISHSGSTINYDAELTQPAIQRRNVFIQNHISTLDLQNEWCYDSATKVISVYSTSLPSVKYSSIDTLIIVAFSNVQFDGLEFQGANMAAISFNGVSNLTVKNCKFNNNGFNALQGISSPFATIELDSFLNTNNNAMRIFGERAIIKNNYIYNAGNIEGLAGSGNSMGVGFFGGNGTDSLKVTNNTFINTGYSSIYFQGTKSLIYRNRIDSFCLNKDDGGGIYCFSTNTLGSVVRSNIITNGIGVSYYAAGIYLDNQTAGVTADSNTIYKTKYSSFHMNDNGAGANFVRANTMVNIGADNLTTFGGGGYHIKNNILYIMDSVGFVYNGTVGILDSNVYLRPLKENFKFSAGATYGFADWKTFTGGDANSSETPSGITSAPGVLHFNATLSPVTKTFAGRYIDAKGVSYTNSIVLQPFTSTLLFYASVQPIVLPKLIGLKYKAVKNL